MLVWYDGTVCLVDTLHGKIMVCDMVCLWYGMGVRCGGCIIWLKNCLVAWDLSAYKVRKSRIRRTNIDCVTTLEIDHWIVLI